MLISSWLRALKSDRSPFSRRRSRRSKRSGRLQVIPQVEQLEDRILLSATGGGEYHQDYQQIETQIINSTPIATAGAAESEGAAAQSSGALSPLESIPILHSNPGATVKLFLDFDGHFEPDYNGIIDITTQAYDVDGDASTFSDTELANIQTIWAMVAEDFAPFNIDVTTEEPAVLAEGVPIDDANGVALRIAIGTSTDGSGGTMGNGSFFDDELTKLLKRTASYILAYWTLL